MDKISIDDYEKLQEQLKEKDNEIVEVKRQLKETKDLHEIERFYLVNQAKQFDEMRKTNTKQICEKIRKNGIKQFNRTNEFILGWLISPDLLDQIEKGQENEKTTI